jgi:predicted nucleic acid-binding protein
MILFLDTSCLVKLFLDEAGSADVEAHEARAAQIAVSSITFAEAYAAFAAGERAAPAGGRFVPRRPASATVGTYDAVDAEFRQRWPRFFAVSISYAVLQRAAILSRRHALRAYDSVQLASAVHLSVTLPEPLEFATWDKDLPTPAKAEGLTTYFRGALI